MGLFERFRSRLKSSKAEQKSAQAWVQLDDIWNIENPDDFVISMFSYVSEKCCFGDRLDTLTDAERTFYAAQVLETEVNNGGFHQFCFNSGGALAEEAARAMREIGAEYTASIVDRAIAALDGGLPRDDSERRELLQARSDDAAMGALESCDKEFLEYREDLTELNRRYILDHKSDFR